MLLGVEEDQLSLMSASETLTVVSSVHLLEAKALGFVILKSLPCSSRSWACILGHPVPLWAWRLPVSHRAAWTQDLAK